MRLPRPIKNSLLPLLLFFAAQKACAQFAPADDYFNGGAQLYISNNIPAALKKTEDGLKFYPDDAKLKKLEELLKQQQKSQSSQSQQNQQQQQSQSQQNANNQKNQQQNRQQQPSQKNSQDQKSDGQQKSSAGNSNGEKKENQNAESQPVAGQMTPEEAKKLLDGQKEDEQILQLKPQGKTEDPNRPVKDW
jgi:Ca-activated chloride channel family protein